MHTKVSVVSPYFEDIVHLERFLSMDWDWVDEIIIVDDGSEVDHAVDFLRECKLPVIEKVRLLRVKENLGFNGHGCRNLGVQQAKNDWVFLIDIDMEVCGNTGERILEELPKLTENQFLGTFARRTLAPNWDGWEVYKQNSPWGSVATDEDYQDVIQDVEYNTYVIRKEQFISTRGYDEEFTNIHGGSRVFVERLQTFLERVMIFDIVTGPTRPGRELRVVEHIEKTEYDDHFIYHPPNWYQVEDLLDMAHARNKKPEEWETKTFVNFDWYEETI
jgi:glycosyltransferase involved in cell wall biosynthesis